MSTEDDLRYLHERNVEVGVDLIVEMVEADGDYVPILQHLAEVMQEIQTTTTALLAVCVEKGLFTMDEFAERRAMASAMIDQFGAKARDEMIEVAKKRLGRTDGSQP